MRGPSFKRLGWFVLLKAFSLLLSGKDCTARGVCTLPCAWVVWPVCARGHEDIRPGPGSTGSCALHVTTSVPSAQNTAPQVTRAETSPRISALGTGIPPSTWTLEADIWKKGVFPKGTGETGSPHFSSGDHFPHKYCCALCSAHFPVWLTQEITRITFSSGP